MEKIDLEMTMDAEQNMTCAELRIPYRYDLGVGRDLGFSYFVDNGLTLGVLCTQDSGAAHHESLNVLNVQAGIVSECSGDTFP